MDYRIKLQNFEGPLDLLLFFISRDKINIYDIPIHKITDEFLKYIEMMKLLKIEVAGEFILMASMLMRIKVLLYKISCCYCFQLNFSKNIVLN